jgi:hypothetical protein
MRSMRTGVKVGLVVVDLMKMSRPQLEKYLGKQGSEGFLSKHDSKKQIM